MTAWDGNWWGSAWNSRPAPPPATYRLTLLAKPTELPITFETACGHLRLGDPAGAEAAAQEPVVGAMIAAAVGEVQRYCDLAVMSQKWKLTAASILSPFLLPKAPLQSVDKVSSADGTVLDPTSYSVELDERLPGLLTISAGSAAAVEFTAGWETAEDVPAELVQAMLLMIGTWFLNRESAQPFSLSVIPGIGVTELLDPFRLEVIG